MLRNNKITGSIQSNRLLGRVLTKLLGLDFIWDGTRLGVKRENEEEYTYSDLVGPAGQNGQDGQDGQNGQDGIGLNYRWNGTSLGIKKENESTYSYTNLQGPAGQDGQDGQDGQNGQDGITPVKGVDYFTAQEIGEIQSPVSDQYDSTHSYATGDYCIYNNTLYRCTGATTGSWDATKWTATSVEDELNSIQSDVSANTSDISNLKKKETKTISTGGVSVNLTKIGKLIVLSIFASKTIQMTSGSNINIGTLPDGWKPLQQQGGSCIIKDSNWKPILGAILVRTSGAIELNQASGSTITTAQILANICYFVN